jgi:hypothetical protein
MDNQNSNNNNPVNPVNSYLNESNALITDILKQFVTSVTVSWDSMHITAEMQAQGVLDVKPFYTSAGIDTQFATPLQAGYKLLKLFKLNSSAEKGNLKKALFTVNKDLKFDIKYEY